MLNLIRSFFGCRVEHVFMILYIAWEPNTRIPIIFMKFEIHMKLNGKYPALFISYSVVSSYNKVTLIANCHATILEIAFVS